MLIKTILLLFVVSGYYSSTTFDCDGRILDSYNYIMNKHNVCQYIQRDNLFLVLIRDHLPGLDHDVTQDTEDFYYSNCKNYGTLCKNGFLISLYIKNRKVRIHAGKNFKEQISISFRESVIDSMKKHLRGEKYTDSVILAIDLIRKKLNNINNPIDEESYDFNGGFISFIVIGIISLIILAFLFSKPKKSVLNYTQFLERTLQQIRNSPEKIIVSKTCFICLNDFPFVNNNDKKDEVLRFGCGHLFHDQCLNKINNYSCLFCVETLNSSNFRKNENENKHNILEDDVMRIARRINKIFTLDEMNQYYSSQQDKVNNYQNLFRMNFSQDFGCRYQNPKTDSNSDPKNSSGDSASGSWGGSGDSGDSASGTW